MPTVSEIGALVVAFFSGVGALAGVTRAWGQNRNERTAALTTEQQQFRESQRLSIQDLQERNAYLSGRLDAIDVRNAELVQANAVLVAQAGVREDQIERLANEVTVLRAGRERLNRRVIELEAKVVEQSKEIVDLRAELAALRRDPGVRTRQGD